MRVADAPVPSVAVRPTVNSQPHRFIIQPASFFVRPVPQGRVVIHRPMFVRLSRPLSRVLNVLAPFCVYTGTSDNREFLFLVVLLIRRIF